MNSVFDADVRSIVDFDFDEPRPDLAGCVEVVVHRIRGFMNLGETVTLILPSNGPRIALRLRGSAFQAERPRTLHTGELPLLLEKPAEIARVRLEFVPGMRLESDKGEI